MIEKKDSFTLIKMALETMELPVMIGKEELKQRYRELSNIHHPDKGGDEDRMVEINSAYRVLKSYMDNFKFSFSKEEIYKQFPQDEYVSKFRF